MKKNILFDKKWIVLAAIVFLVIVVYLIKINNISPVPRVIKETPATEHFSFVVATSSSFGTIASPQVSITFPSENVKMPETEQKKSDVKIILKDINCTSGEARDACYDRFYREIVLTEGVDLAFADIKKRYEKDSFVKTQCHQIVHTAGRTAVLLYPDISDAYSHGDSFCWSGYYHGVVEAFIQKIGKENFAEGKGINDICRPLRERSRYSFDHYNCVHGIGHGLMYIHNNELFISLDICDTLNDPWERSSCYGGAFMENLMVDNKNHFTKYLKPEDPLYPCTAVGEQYKEQCYLMQTSYMLRLKGGNFSSVFDLCRTVADPNKKTCFQSIGRDASGQTLSDPVRTKDYCLLGKGEMEQSSCVIGAVKDFISYYHSDVQAKSFCAALPENLSTTCFSTGENYYKVF